MTVKELSPGADASSLDVADNLKLAASASEVVLYSSSATESEEAFSPKKYIYETEGSYGESPASDTTEDLATGIPEFFRGRSILVTGATGFMGKVLVEKLLRSCPEVSTIYVILRAKRGRTVQERLPILLESKVFDRIRDEKSLEKVVAVEGDVSAPGLALSSDDIHILSSRVSVIFHCAASIRFQEPLRDAVLLNVRGSREVARLALRMPHLQALVHVSTAYSNCDRNLIEELVYPPPADYNQIIEYAEKLDEKSLDSIAPKLMKNLPNTYIFSKSLAEHVMYSFKGLLPIAICRPSVVSPSYCEPYPGWVDSFYGPMGLLIGASLGVLKSVQGNGDVKTDILPVDFGINALIAIAWDTAMNKKHDISVYNCTTSSEMPVTWNKFLKEGEKQYMKYPLTKMLWFPGGAMHRSYIMYLVYFLLLQMIPAILLDTVLYISGKKTRFIKLQKKIYNSGSTINYFLLKEWIFTNNNIKRLSAKLNKSDKGNFNFDASTINFCQYVEHWAVGSRRFMMKLDDSTIPEAKKALKRLYWADWAVKISFGLLLVAVIFLF